MTIAPPPTTERCPSSVSRRRILSFRTPPARHGGYRTWWLVVRWFCCSIAAIGDPFVSASWRNIASTTKLFVPPVPAWWLFPWMPRRSRRRFGSNFDYPSLSSPTGNVASCRNGTFYNPKEKGGIARPAVFILAPDRTVRFVSVDGVSARVPAADIVAMLREHTDTMPTRRKRLSPTLSTFFCAARNALRFGARQPKAQR